jgi:hypothetical protein
MPLTATQCQKSPAIWIGFHSVRVDCRRSPKTDRHTTCVHDLHQHNVDSRTTCHTDDAVGNRLTSTDPLGHTTRAVAQLATMHATLRGTPRPFGGGVSHAPNCGTWGRSDRVDRVETDGDDSGGAMSVSCQQILELRRRGRSFRMPAERFRMPAAPVK